MSGKRIDLSGEYRFCGRICAEVGEELAGGIFTELFESFCFTCATLDKRIVDGHIFRVGGVALPEVGEYEFAIRISGGGVAVVGRDRRGLLHGYYTLLEMIRPISLDEGMEEFALSACEIYDAPDLEIRAAHFCLFPENKLYELERFIRVCAILKCTHISLEFWGTLKFDCLAELGWADAHGKDEIRELIGLARELGVEVIPTFNHWGHATQSRGRLGKHTVIDQNPRLATMFNRTGWVWEIGQDRVRALHREIRRELIELCGEGDFFHIECDEAYEAEGVEGLCEFTDYLGEVCAELKALGRRPMMWADMLLLRERFPRDVRYSCNLRCTEAEDVMLAGVPREVIAVDWQYEVTEHPFKTSEHLKALGFEVMTAPYDRSYANPAAAVRTATELGLKGVMHTTWHTMHRGMRHLHLTLRRAWNKDFVWCDGEMMYVSALVGKAFPSGGDYARSGWSERQIGPGIE